MSDIGRKSFTDKARESVIPDESKPLSQKIKESFTGAADRVAAAVQPKETKSTSQTVADKLTGTKDKAKHDVNDPHRV